MAPHSQASPTLASWTVDFHILYIIYYIYIYIIRRTSFRKCKLTLLTQNVAHAEFKCGQNIENNTQSAKYSTVSVSALLLSFRFRLQVLLSMDTQSSYRRALKPVQEREVAEDWRWPRNEKDGLISGDVLQPRLILSHFKYGYCHLHVPCCPLGWGCFQCNTKFLEKSS